MRGLQEKGRHLRVDRAGGVKLAGRHENNNWMTLVWEKSVLRKMTKFEGSILQKDALYDIIEKVSLSKK